MNGHTQHSARPQVVLLIVGLQRGMQRDDLSPRSNPGVKMRVIELFAAQRAVGRLVAYVRRIPRRSGSPSASGQLGVEFQLALVPRDDEAMLEKNIPGTSINSDLQRWLHVRDICQVVLIGTAIENPVEASVRSADNLGFQAWVVTDACFTFTKPDLRDTPHGADEIYAMVLASLHGEYAVVLCVAELLQRLPA